MHPELRSLLVGAAVAVLLIVPTLVRGETLAHGDPPAAAAHDGNWVVLPQKTYQAQALHIEDVIGTVRIAVKEAGPISVTVSGSRAAVDSLAIEARGGTLRIEGSDESPSVWNWRNWFDFSNLDGGNRAKLALAISVPRGAAVSIDDLIGNATIGDTEGPLRLEASASKTRIGKVSRARIELNGAGRVDIARVTGELKFEINGSGKITAGPVGTVKAEMAGSGDAIIGPIKGGMDLDIAGSGNMTATRVNGPMHVSIAGAGSVKIGDGVADPFHVDIMGSGDVTFGGLAVNPKISALGSGTVKIKAYRGHLRSQGMANVKIGE